MPVKTHPRFRWNPSIPRDIIEKKRKEKKRKKRKEKTRFQPTLLDTPYVAVPSIAPKMECCF